MTDIWWLAVWWWGCGLVAALWLWWRADEEIEALAYAMLLGFGPLSLMFSILGLLMRIKVKPRRR